MQNNTKNQHFVPVCYLKNFCPDSDQHKKNPKVWTYDKLSQSTKLRGVKSICHSNKLYSINNRSESIITNNIEDKETIFESHYLHDFEQEYSVRLKNAIASIKQEKFGGQNKLDISVFIAVQYLRDPILKTVFDSNEKIPFFSLSEEYMKLCNNSPELLNDSAMRHFMYGYGNKNAITTLAQSLALSEWTIHYNRNDVFFTSDNPVCLAQDKQNSSDNEQLLNILFPLSKNILLQIKKGIQINNVYFINNTPQELIDNLNFVQAYFAKKYVISASNSFKVIKDRLKNTLFSWDYNKLKIYGKTENANHKCGG